MEPLLQSEQQQLRDCLIRYGLDSDSLSIAPLKAGVDNLNLLIEEPGGRFVLRRYDITAPSEVPFEVHLIKHLRRSNFPTPNIRETVDGELISSFGLRAAALFQFVEGRHGEIESVQDAVATADLIGRLHTATADFIPPCARSRTDVNRIENLRKTLKNTRRMGRDLERFLQDANALVERTREMNAQSGAIPSGVIHHDPNPGNVLFRPDGHVTALLDFDESHIAPLITDLITVIHYWGASETEPEIDFRRASDLVRSYMQHRPLSTAEQRMMPDYMCFYYAADAAEYFYRQLASDPNQPIEVTSSFSYQRFRLLSENPGWFQDLAQLCFDGKQ